MTGSGGLVRSCEDLSDDELLAALGSALDGTGLEVSPVDPARVSRFARQWLDRKAEGLRQRVQRSETYRIWLASAGPEQVIEADEIAVALVGDGLPADIAAPVAVALQRAELATAQSYDVALTCAQTESDYVQRVVAAARSLGLRVFHAAEMTYEWWGRNFIAEGRRVYGRRTWHFVPFLSAGYLVEPQLRDAFESAIVTAFERGDDYILPVLVGDVRVPAELLNPMIGYLRAEAHSPQELAAALAKKVAMSKASAIEARDIGVIVRNAYPERPA